MRRESRCSRAICDTSGWMHTSGSPRSAHSRCTCSHRGPVGSHATATRENPFPRACPTAQSSAVPAGTPSPAPFCAPAPAHRDPPPRSPACPPPGRSRSPRHPAAAAPAAAPAALPPPVSPRRATAATLTHRTSSLLRLGHQARTIAPGGRSRTSHTPAGQRPPARCPITTPCAAISQAASAETRAHGTPLCQDLAEGGFRLWSGGSGKWLVRRAGVRGQEPAALESESSPIVLPDPLRAFLSASMLA